MDVVHGLVLPRGLVVVVILGGARRTEAEQEEGRAECEALGDVEGRHAGRGRLEIDERG